MARRQQAAAPAPAPAMTMLPLPDARLARVEHGPDVLMTPAAEAQVEEWITGWAASGKLQSVGISPPGPLFMHGPPGTGKTAVTRMIARRLGGVRQVVVIDAMRVTESWLGATSANIAKAADAAIADGAVLVLEEIDTLASDRLYESSAAVENTRATTSIMRVLELKGPIILTSNRIDVIDPAVLRRCEYIFEMPVPTAAQRRAILARELGLDDPEVLPWTDLPLTSAIPLARRARRNAVLAGRDPAEEYAALLKAQPGEAGTEGGRRIDTSPADRRDPRQR